MVLHSIVLVNSETRNYDPLIAKEILAKIHNGVFLKNRIFL